MDAAAVLRLRDGRRGSPSATNNRVERTKNRKLIDAALREAEVLRYKSAQLGRVWKQNSDLLRTERSHRQQVDEMVVQQTQICNAQIRNLHDSIIEMESSLATLETQHSSLAAAIKRYEGVCMSALRETELLATHVTSLQRSKDAIVESIAQKLETSKEALGDLELLMKSVDAELEVEELENLQLKMAVGLGDVDHHDSDSSLVGRTKL